MNNAEVENKQSRCKALYQDRYRQDQEIQVRKGSHPYQEDPEDEETLEKAHSRRCYTAEDNTQDAALLIIFGVEETEGGIEKWQESKVA